MVKAAGSWGRRQRNVNDDVFTSGRFERTQHLVDCHPYLSSFAADADHVARQRAHVDRQRRRHHHHRQLCGAAQEACQYLHTQLGCRRPDCMFCGYAEVFTVARS